MNLLVVPKPIFNNKINAEAYYFSYQYGNAILEGVKPNPFDRSMDSPFFDFMNKVGLEALTMDKLIFVPVTNILLILELQDICKVDRAKVVFLLDKKNTFDALCLERIKRYKDFGFKIAVKDIDNLDLLQEFYPYLDYIFFNLPPESIKARLEYLRNANKDIKLVLTDIESASHFDRVKNSGVPLFDGNFYKVHVSKGKQNTVSPLKVNYIQLINVVSKDDFDLKEFISVVQRDTALAIQFMTLVNSSGRITSQIKTINHAAAMLGQLEIKKWITTAVSSMLSQDKPSEVTRTSLIRAKFCENMARHFEMAIHKENLFLMGLFSVIDVILEIPISEALKLVFVPEPIREALEFGRGNFNDVYEFIKLYELGEWHEISRTALVRNIKISEIHEAYADSLTWYSNLINMIEVE